MAHKPRFTDQQQREQRQRGYEQSTTVSQQFPRVSELVLEIRFTGAQNKPLLSPYKQIYTGDMQAFFALQCPSKECAGGGFDLQAAVARAAGRPGGIGHEQMSCSGVRTDSEARGQPCPIEMVVDIEAKKRSDS